MLTLFLADLTLDVSKVVNKFPFLYDKERGFLPFIAVLDLILTEKKGANEHKIYHSDDTFFYIYAQQMPNTEEADLVYLKELYHTFLYVFTRKRKPKPNSIIRKFQKELDAISLSFLEKIPDEYSSKTNFLINDPVLTLTYAYQGQCNMQFERDLLTKDFPNAILCVTCFNQS